MPPASSRATPCSSRARAAACPQRPSSSPMPPDWRCSSPRATRRQAATKALIAIGAERRAARPAPACRARSTPSSNPSARPPGAIPIEIRAPRRHHRHLRRHHRRPAWSRAHPHSSSRTSACRAAPWVRATISHDCCAFVEHADLHPGDRLRAQRAGRRARGLPPRWSPATCSAEGRCSAVEPHRIMY